MNKATFWSLIDSTRPAIISQQHDTYEHVDMLIKALVKLPPQEITTFGQAFTSLRRKLFSPTLQYLIGLTGGHATDDAAEHKLNLVIARGETAYLSILTNPDNWVVYLNNLGLPPSERRYFEQEDFMDAPFYALALRETSPGTTLESYLLLEFDDAPPYADYEARFPPENIAFGYDENPVKQILSPATAMWIRDLPDGEGGPFTDWLHLYTLSPDQFRARFPNTTAETPAFQQHSLNH